MTVGTERAKQNLSSLYICQLPGRGESFGLDLARLAVCRQEGVERKL